MKEKVFTIIFAVITSLSHSWLSFAENLEKQSNSFPVETWGCAFNEGHDMNDLMAVVEEWNEWADETNSANYNAFIMTPLFHPSGMNSMIGWMGNWADWASMGDSLETLYTDGGKILEEFSKVWNCSSRSVFGGRIVRPPPEKITGNAITTFYNCNMKEGKDRSDLLAADKKWAEYLDSTNDKSAIVNLWPGPGNLEDFEFKVSIWEPSLGQLGRSWELWSNGGGAKMWSEIYNDAVECSDPGRGYSATRVRVMRD